PPHLRQPIISGIRMCAAPDHIYAPSLNVDGHGVECTRQHILAESDVQHDRWPRIRQRERQHSIGCDPGAADQGACGQLLLRYSKSRRGAVVEADIETRQPELPRQSDLAVRDEAEILLTHSLARGNVAGHSANEGAARVPGLLIPPEPLRQW